MKEKRIALLISSFLPNLGGMEVGLHNIAIRLKKRGYIPVVIAPYSHVKKLKTLGWNLPYKVEASPPKLWSILQLWPKIGFKITNLYLSYLQWKYEFSFWHVTMGYPAGCAMVHFAEAKGDKVKYLIRCAGEDIQRAPDIGYGMRLDPMLDKVIRHYLCKASKLVAITDSVYDEYLKVGVADEAIYRVPNGITLERFKNQPSRKETRGEYGIRDQDFLILSVGRNHPKKNFISLIEAAEKLKNSGLKNFKVCIVGKGCSNLAKDVKERQLSNYVILVEEIGTHSQKMATLDFPSDELISLYQSSDIFVFPSLTETFGIAIVEAMAAGLPVIVGDSDGCRDIVGKGDWGVMVEPRNSTALAKEIKALIESPELRRSWQEKSCQRALEFDWDNVVDQYINLYFEQ